MGDLLHLPIPLGHHVVSLDLFLEADGRITARVQDMPASVIDRMGGEVGDKMLQVALWTQLAAEDLAEQAGALGIIEDSQ